MLSNSLYYDSFKSCRRKKNDIFFFSSRKCFEVYMNLRFPCCFLFLRLVSASEILHLLWNMQISHADQIYYSFHLTIE